MGPRFRLPQPILHRRLRAVKVAITLKNSVTETEGGVAGPVVVPRPGLLVKNYRDGVAQLGRRRLPLLVGHLVAGLPPACLLQPRLVLGVRAGLDLLPQRLQVLLQVGVLVRGEVPVVVGLQVLDVAVLELLVARAPSFPTPVLSPGLSGWVQRLYDRRSPGELPRRYLPDVNVCPL